MTQTGSGFQPQTKIPERGRRSPAIRPEFLSPQPPPGSAQLLPCSAFPTGVQPPQPLISAPRWNPCTSAFVWPCWESPRGAQELAWGRRGEAAPRRALWGAPVLPGVPVLVPGDVTTSIPAAGWTRGGARGASPRPHSRAGPAPAWAAATSSLRALPKPPVPSKPFPRSWSWPRRGLALRFWSCQHKKRAGRAAAAGPLRANRRNPSP